MQRAVLNLVKDNKGSPFFMNTNGLNIFENVWTLPPLESIQGLRLPPEIVPSGKKISCIHRT